MKGLEKGGLGSPVKGGGKCTMYENATVTDQNRLVVERHHNRINRRHRELAGGIICVARN